MLSVILTHRGTHHRPTVRVSNRGPVLPVRGGSTTSFECTGIAIIHDVLDWCGAVDNCNLPVEENSLLHCPSLGAARQHFDHDRTFLSHSTTKGGAIYLRTACCLPISTFDIRACSPRSHPPSSDCPAGLFGGIAPDFGTTHVGWAACMAEHGTKIKNALLLIYPLRHFSSLCGNQLEPICRDVVVRECHVERKPRISRRCAFVGCCREKFLRSNPVFSPVSPMFIARP